MKNLLIGSLLLIATTSAMAIDCPTNLLVKKIGAKTLYTQDLKTKYSMAELAKFGCAVNPKVMSKEQVVKLIDAQAAAQKAKL